MNSIMSNPFDIVESGGKTSEELLEENTKYYKKLNDPRNFNIVEKMKLKQIIKHNESLISKLNKK